MYFIMLSGKEMCISYELVALISYMAPPTFYMWSMIRNTEMEMASTTDSVKCEGRLHARVKLNVIAFYRETNLY